MPLLDDSAKCHFVLQLSNNRNFYHNKLYRISFSQNFSGHYDSVWNKYAKIEDLYVYKYGIPKDTLEANGIGHYVDYIWQVGDMNLVSVVSLYELLKLPSGSFASIRRKDSFKK